jgi:hypothetical protein
MWSIECAKQLSSVVFRTRLGRLWRQNHQRYLKTHVAQGLDLPVVEVLFKVDRLEHAKCSSVRPGGISRNLVQSGEAA